MSNDGRLVRVRLKFERDFTQIPNDWLRDPNLSLRAIGILAQLMSHKDGYVVTFQSLAATNMEGISAIRTAVSELRANDYLEIVKLRGRGGVIIGSTWSLTDPAEKKARSQPKLDYPYVDEPHAAEPHADNRILKEAQSQEHLNPRLNEVLVDARGGKEDALPRDSHPVATESPAERYERLIAEKCPGRPYGRSHVWLGSGYCEHCGKRQPVFDMQATPAGAEVDA